MAYARERPQGRALGAKGRGGEPVPIIQHADVRRMLLAQKSWCEGALALSLFAAYLVDEEKTAPDCDERERAHLLLEVLTPIVKSWPSEWCLEANKFAIQILGGYGYAREYPVEQLYRDNRLNLIHEGTNGIQALDLLGRKVAMLDGAAFDALCAAVRETIRESGGCALHEYRDALDAALDRVESVTGTLVDAQTSQGAELALANAHDYLEMLGSVVIAWMWLRQAATAEAALSHATDESERAFYQGKLSACQYFYRFCLPKVWMQADWLERLDDTVLRIHDDGF